MEGPFERGGTVGTLYQRLISVSKPSPLASGRAARGSGYDRGWLGSPRKLPAVDAGLGTSGAGTARRPRSYPNSCSHVPAVGALRHGESCLSMVAPSAAPLPLQSGPVRLDILRHQSVVLMARLETSFANCPTAHEPSRRHIGRIRRAVPVTGERGAARRTSVLCHATPWGMRSLQLHPLDLPVPRRQPERLVTIRLFSASPQPTLRYFPIAWMLEGQSYASSCSSCPPLTRSTH
jgi:hypothetical protein